VTYLIDGVIDGTHGESIGNCISNANRHAVLEQPMVGEVLTLTQEGSCSLWAMLHHDDMDQRSS